MLPVWEIKMLEAELEKRKQEREVKDNEAITRLAEYEGSGLSPDEVQEFAKAKADGRLKILPAKPGDIIYRPEALRFCWVITKVEIYEDEIVFIDDSDNIFRTDDIGKTVFLTHEEAEKVLEAKRREEKKDDLQNYLKS